MWLRDISDMTRLGQFTDIGRKVVAVGRNYADHAKELGNAVGSLELISTLILTLWVSLIVPHLDQPKVPTKPLLFMKPTSAYITAGQSIQIPHGYVKA